MYTLRWYNSHIPQWHCVVVSRGVSREIQILLAVHMTTYTDIIWNTFSLSPLSLSLTKNTHFLGFTISHDVAMVIQTETGRGVCVCVCVCERERERMGGGGGGGGREKEFVCV